MKPLLSLHFQNRGPSAIRLSEIAFLKRTDKVKAVNTAIGNVSLPMHPAMVQRLFTLGMPDTPFAKGVVKYSTTIGEVETNQTFLHLLEISGFSSKGLYTQITDGGSQAMELAILGICGPAGSNTLPLLLIDPAYSNYSLMAERTGRSTVTVTRHLEESGKFSFPKFEEIEEVIQKRRPAGLLVIPYDNPTGQFVPQKTMNEIGKLCVKHNLWMLSDEAYRELFYVKGEASSIWGISEKEVPGISGRRISIESASKIWNACGLRIGSIITDNLEFHQKSVAENTANLCANVIGQYIFGALLKQPKSALQSWFQKQREYYQKIAITLTEGLKKEIPGLIISMPESSLYTVIDFRKICPDNFNTTDFAMFCAEKGKVKMGGVDKTLLAAPMSGFYSSSSSESNPGKRQMRIAYVEPPEIMAEVPTLLAQLLTQYSNF